MLCCREAVDYSEEILVTKTDLEVNRNMSAQSRVCVLRVSCVGTDVSGLVHACAFVSLQSVRVHELVSLQIISGAAYWHRLDACCIVVERSVQLLCCGSHMADATWCVQ